MQNCALIFRFIEIREEDVGFAIFAVDKVPLRVPDAAWQSGSFEPFWAVWGENRGSVVVGAERKRLTKIKKSAII